MGGDAFRSGPNALYTPRMSPDVYLYVKKYYYDALLKYFTNVTTPIEAPEKNTYGDVDYLVSIPRANYKGPDQLMNDLGAVQLKSGVTSNYAVPWPAHMEDNPNQESDNQSAAMPESAQVKDSENQGKKKFIQIDVAVDQTGNEFYDWEVFHKSHGDLWNMLGSTIRRFGITVDHRGLHFRIQEIELIDKKRSMIPMTNNPREVLQFLELDEDTYWKPFRTVRDLFEYAASNKFFYVKRNADGEANDELTPPQADHEKKGNADIEKDLAKDKRELKHNDRQRMNKRPLFARWIEGFIPECRQEGRFLREVPTREETMQDIFDKFPYIKLIYDEKVDKFRKERQKDELWKINIKTGVPEIEDQNLRSAAIRGLKAIVINEDYALGLTPPKSLKRKDGFYETQEVIEYVRNNWEKVGEAEVVANKKRMEEKMAAKRLKAAEQTVQEQASVA